MAHVLGLVERVSFTTVLLRHPVLQEGGSRLLGPRQETPDPDRVGLPSPMVGPDRRTYLPFIIL